MAEMQRVGYVIQPGNGVDLVRTLDIERFVCIRINVHAVCPVAYERRIGRGPRKIHGLIE